MHRIVVGQVEWQGTLVEGAGLQLEDTSQRGGGGELDHLGEGGGGQLFGIVEGRRHVEHGMYRGGGRRRDLKNRNVSLFRLGG